MRTFLSNVVAFMRNATELRPAHALALKLQNTILLLLYAVLRAEAIVSFTLPLERSSHRRHNSILL